MNQNCYHFFVCCHCQGNLSPGSGGGSINVKNLNEHFYCYACYPKLVDVYVADLKLKKALNDDVKDS